jgi:hypothetical protein
MIRLSFGFGKRKALQTSQVRPLAKHIEDGGTGLYCSVFSPSGSFIATSFQPKIGSAGTVALYELETMTITKSDVIPGFIPTRIAVTSDSKQLVVVGRRGGRVDFFRQTIEAFKETSIKKRSDQATVGKG